MLLGETNRNTEAKIGPLQLFRRQTAYTSEKPNGKKATIELATLLGCTFGHNRLATGFNLYLQTRREYNVHA